MIDRLFEIAALAGGKTCHEQGLRLFRVELERPVDQFFGALADHTAIGLHENVGVIGQQGRIVVHQRPRLFEGLGRF